MKYCVDHLQKLNEQGPVKEDLIQKLQQYFRIVVNNVFKMNCHFSNYFINNTSPSNKLVEKLLLFRSRCCATSRSGHVSCVVAYLQKSSKLTFFFFKFVISVSGRLPKLNTWHKKFQRACQKKFQNDRASRRPPSSPSARPPIIIKLRRFLGCYSSSGKNLSTSWRSQQPVDVFSLFTRSNRPKRCAFCQRYCETCRNVTGYYMLKYG